MGVEDVVKHVKWAGVERGDASGEAGRAVPRCAARRGSGERRAVWPGAHVGTAGRWEQGRAGPKRQAVMAVLHASGEGGTQAAGGTACGARCSGARGREGSRAREGQAGSGERPGEGAGRANAVRGARGGAEQRREKEGERGEKKKKRKWKKGKEKRGKEKEKGKKKWRKREEK